MTAPRLPKVFTHVPYEVVADKNPAPYLDAQPGDLLVGDKYKASIWPGIPANDEADGRDGDYWYNGPSVIPLSVTRQINDFDATYGASNGAFDETDIELRIDANRPDVRVHLNLHVRSLLAALDVDMTHPRVTAVLQGKQSDYIYVVVETPDDPNSSEPIKYMYTLRLVDEDGLTIVSLIVNPSRVYWKIERTPTECTILCDKNIVNPNKLEPPKNWDWFGSEPYKSYLMFQGDYDKIDRQKAYLRAIEATQIRILEPDHTLAEMNKKGVRKVIWSDGAKARWYYKWKKIFKLSLVAYDLGLPPYVVLEIVDWLPGMWAHNHQKKITLIQSVWNGVRRIREKRALDAEAKKPAVETVK